MPNVMVALPNIGGARAVKLHAGPKSDGDTVYGMLFLSFAAELQHQNCTDYNSTVIKIKSRVTGSKPVQIWGRGPKSDGNTTVTVYVIPAVFALCSLYESLFQVNSQHYCCIRAVKLHAVAGISNIFIRMITAIHMITSNTSTNDECQDNGRLHRTNHYGVHNIVLVVL